VPYSPKRPCAEPGCPILVDKGRCPAHAPVRTPWVHATPVQRIRGEKLQRLRAQLFAKQPLCALCLQAGRVTIATIRDHIVNLAAPGGTDTVENTQGLCEACHTKKTEDERKRGIRRR